MQKPALVEVPGSNKKTNKNEGNKKMQNNNTETIELTKRSAWVALERLYEWLEYIEWLDDETRRDVIALDELVRALDAEAFITDKRDKVIAERAAEWAAHKAKAEEGTKN
jgi:hypothetical protein